MDTPAYPEALAAQTQSGARPCRAGGLALRQRARPNPSSTTKSSRREWNLPIRHGHSPIKHGHSPSKHGHSPSTHGHLPIKHGHLQIKHGHVPIKNGHLPMKHGHFPINQVRAAGSRHGRSPHWPSHPCATASRGGGGYAEAPPHLPHPGWGRRPAAAAAENCPLGGNAPVEGVRRGLVRPASRRQAGAGAGTALAGTALAGTAREVAAREVTPEVMRGRMSARRSRERAGCASCRRRSSLRSR
jgi:hypothetical protein